MRAGLACVGLSARVSKTSGSASCFFHRLYLRSSCTALLFIFSINRKAQEARRFHEIPRSSGATATEFVSESAIICLGMPRYQYSTERKPLATSPMRTCKEAQTHARGERCVFIIKPLFMSSVAHHWTCKSFKDRLQETIHLLQAKYEGS